MAPTESPFGDAISVIESCQHVIKAIATDVATTPLTPSTVAVVVDLVIHLECYLTEAVRLADRGKQIGYWLFLTC